jgi:lipopolysaccharide biosynthesis protein
LRDFPQADIHVMANRGRDVRPFLALLDAGRLDRYAAICKIHSKKSRDGGRQAALGAIWRRRMIFDQLGAPDAASAILDWFARDPKVGMIGSAAYRYPSRLCNLERSWGENRPRVLELAAKMGAPRETYRLDFFCGSMFWARPEALRPLRELKLVDAFEPEAGRLDGALENAVERLFATSAVVAGFRLEGVDGFALQAPRSGPAAAREADHPFGRAAT